MTYTWHPKDVVCGRIVCKPKEYSGEDNLGNQAKWLLKIGFFAGGNPERDYVIPKGLNKKEREKFLDENKAEYCLIAMTDGMIGEKLKTKIEMAQYLNENQMIPASHSRVMGIMDYLRDCYEENV